MDIDEKRARQAAYQRAWYERNKAQHLALVGPNRDKYIERNKQIVNEAKAVPCTDCGIQFAPFAMDFDHIDGEKKIAAISAMVRTPVGISKLLEEIRKCEVVCAVCHRFRTAKRAGWVS